MKPTASCCPDAHSDACLNAHIGCYIPVVPPQARACGSFVYPGQHLLHHPRTIKQLIDTIRPQPSDTVLEIGAGKGSLTFPIAARAGKVIAVEKERRRFAAFASHLLREPRLMAEHALGTIFTQAQLKITLRLAHVRREQAVASLSLEQWAALFLAMLQHVAPHRWPRG